MFDAEGEAAWREESGQVAAEEQRQRRPGAEEGHKAQAGAPGGREKEQRFETDMLSPQGKKKYYN